MSSKKSNMKLFTGILLGAGLGLMFAPQEGSKTRKVVKEKLDELTQKIKEIDVKEVQAELTKKINSLKEEVADLDKEKALQITEEQLKKLQKKAEDLYAYAKEKGTPYLEKAALEVKDQIYKYASMLVKKLEPKEEKKVVKKTTNTKKTNANTKK